MAVLKRWFWERFSPQEDIVFKGWCNSTAGYIMNANGRQGLVPVQIADAILKEKETGREPSTPLRRFLEDMIGHESPYDTPDSRNLARWVSSNDLILYTNRLRLLVLSSFTEKLPDICDTYKKK